MLRWFGRSAVTVVALSAALALPAVQAGAVPLRAIVTAPGMRGTPSGNATTGPRRSGADISWPQCGKRFPRGQAFGIVGVNDGLANAVNPCLGPSASYPSDNQSELYWAEATSSGVTAEPRASVYVNTADPGDAVADWPTSGSSPFGPCRGGNTEACAYAYGTTLADNDLADVSAAVQTIGQQESTVSMPLAAGYPWWLDVETTNSWRTGRAGLAMNVADLRGMVDELEEAGAVVGVYSTALQWNEITADPSGSTAGSLAGLDDWVAGATSARGARQECAQLPFTAGTVALAEWMGRTLDGDVFCGP